MSELLERPSRPAIGQPDAPDPWRALPVLLAGVFLIVLDFFIVNVALPAMQTELDAGTSAIEWVVAGYGLTFAVLLLAAGPLCDRWGRRRLFAVGIGVFTVASLACGSAPNPDLLITARLVQGAASALISTSVLAIIGATFTGADRRRAIGMYATVMGVAAASGQLIGGLLLAADPAGLGWRTVFLINVPVGAAALALTRRLVPESRAQAPGRTDPLSLALATVGLTAVVLPLLEGRQQGWPAWTWACLAAAPVLLAAFALRQRALIRTARPPLLDVRLFGSRSFTAGLLGQFTLFAGQASYFLVLALYLQQGRGLTALRCGLVFTIMAASYLVTSSKATALTARWGRLVVTTGAGLLAAGHLAALLATAETGLDGSVLTLAPALLLAGTGMGLCIPALTGTVLANANPQQAGAVSGALSTVQQVGNALGVAVVGLVFFGQVHLGYAHAFEVSLAVLAGLIGGLALLSVLLPGRTRAAQ